MDTTLPLLFPEEPFVFKGATLYLSDCVAWLSRQPDLSFQAVVTDPPYGLHEYSEGELEKLRTGSSGVWRTPPVFGGSVRSPLPRFTVLSKDELEELKMFFTQWGNALFPKLVPGANVVVASNPLMSYAIADAIIQAGFERRGEIIRLVQTMRGGDRPKGAENEFPDVSSMPRSMWEPWLVFRKPLEGTVKENLRKWATGGFRRESEEKPFGDVIESSPTRKTERQIAAHPSLKPQAFLRKVVRGSLPLGEGVVLDPFAGSGSTLAAAVSVGYQAVGVERDSIFFNIAQKAIPELSALL